MCTYKESVKPDSLTWYIAGSIPDHVIPVIETGMDSSCTKFATNSALSVVVQIF